MTIRRTSRESLRKAINRGKADQAAEAPPAGISPMLRASWKFARETAKKFNQQLAKDRTAEFLKKLTKRFT